MIQTRLHCPLPALATLAVQAVSDGYPMALWQMPHQKEKHLLIDLSGQPVHCTPDLSELPAGFLIAPFQNEGKAYFLHADLYFRSDSQTVQEGPRTQAYGTPLYERKETFSKMKATTQKPSFFAAPSRDHSVDWPTYRETLQRGLKRIAAGDFIKFVLSRTKTYTLAKDFSLLDTFEALCQRYPNAFVSLVSAPGIGTWMSATPETLISQDENGIFRTMALAGTQSRAGLSSLKQASWREKEIEEQAMVSRYIINCFKKIRLREFQEEGPKTVAAGNLIHLRTDFWVDTRAAHFPELPTVMLQLLHPTSAVCGMPKEPALEFLLRHENYDRSFYSGYLGPTNLHGNTQLFVQLRCMQVRNQQAILYAGGGITRDSVAEQEWQETEMKFETLGSVLAS
ncbi:MAG: chorismate-binding protein [Bernardetiaceae bacterium]